MNYIKRILARSQRSIAAVGLSCGVLAGVSYAQQALSDAGAAFRLEVHPARQTDAALLAPINEATRTGTRIVAVGANGVILLSDDEGKSFRQAKSVPVRSTLNSVSFVDQLHGWAVGHWGIVLGTEDGGESWKILRQDTNVDQPLFSVHFKNKEEGIAVGLWSLMLATKDGGKTWSTVQLANAPGRNKADLNLMHIFKGSNNDLFIAAEQGVVLKSSGDWQRWDYFPTGYRGTLWTGVMLPDGKLIVGGLRGSMFYSNDDGKMWTPIDTKTKSSITNIAYSKGIVKAVGLDGIALESSDDGITFTSSQRDDRLSYSALVPSNAGGFVLFSRKGPIAAAGQEPRR